MIWKQRAAVIILGRFYNFPSEGSLNEFGLFSLKRRLRGRSRYNLQILSSAKERSILYLCGRVDEKKRIEIGRGSLGLIIRKNFPQ